MALDFRFKPQHGPARFGIEETGIGDPNLSDARHIQTGVIDKSGAVITEAIGSAIQDTGKIAIAADQYNQQRKKGQALSELQSELQGNIQQFTDSQGNPRIAQESLISAAQSREAETDLTAEWFKGTPGVEMQQIQAVRDSHANSLATLQKAQSQGRMSIQQFQDRTLAITREHINRNPALMGELVAHSKQVLGITGMDSYVNQIEQTEKDVKDIEEKRKTRILELADKHDVPYEKFSDNSIDHDSTENEIRRIQRMKQASAIAENASRMDTSLTKAQSVDWLRKEGPNILVGGFNDVTDHIKTVFDPSIKGHHTEKVTLLEEFIDNKKRNLRASVISKGVSGNEDVEKFLTKTELHYDNLLKHIKSFESGEDALKYAETQEKLYRSNEWMRFIEQHGTSPQQVEMLTKLMSAFGPAFLADNPKFYDQTVKIVKDLTSRVIGSANVDYTAKLPNGLPIVAGTFGQMLSVLGKDKTAINSNTLGSIENVIYSIHGDMQNDKVSKLDKYQFVDEFTKNIVGTEQREGLKKLSGESIGKISQLLEDHMTDTLGDYSEYKNKLESQGITINMIPVGDKSGRVVFGAAKGGVRDPETIDILNRKYGKRINNNITALSNVMQSTMGQAAEVIYSRHDPLKGLLQQKEGEEKKKIETIPESPTTLKTRKELFGSLEQEHKLPSGLLEAIMMVESSGKPNQESNKHLPPEKRAKGYFQFMDPTAKQYDVKVNDLGSEAKGAAKFLSDLNKQYKGDIPKILAAYNWGQGAMAKEGMENMPEETRKYIGKVLSKLYS